MFNKKYVAKAFGEGRASIIPALRPTVWTLITEIGRSFTIKMLQDPDRGRMLVEIYNQKTFCAVPPKRDKTFGDRN